MGNPTRAIGAHQFASDFVVGDFWHEYTRAMCEDLNQALLECWLSAFPRGFVTSPSGPASRRTITAALLEELTSRRAVFV